MGNILNEIKSLMLRMEQVEGGGTNFVNEVDYDCRIATGPNEFFDVIAGIGENKYVTMGYVRAVPELDLPNGATLSDFINVPYAKSLIKVTVYNFRWQKNNTVRNAYAKWREFYTFLGGMYIPNFQGLNPPAYHNTNLNYGKDGITAYDDDNEKKLGNTYTPLNFKQMKNEWTKSTFYIVKDDGHIEEIDANRLKFKSAPQTSIEKNIEEIVNSQPCLHPDIVKALTGMDYRLFLHSNILFISATTDKKPVLYINEFLSKELIEDTGVNQNDLIQIAKDRYSNDRTVQAEAE